MNQNEVRDFSKLLKLPMLVGKPNEVQLAEKIRAEKLEQVPWFEANWETFLSELENKYLPDDSLLQLRQQDDAKFWIENSDLSFWELLALFG